MGVRMKTKSLLAALCGLSLTLLASMAYTADVPRYVNFQAVLRDDSGNLLEGDNVNLEFKIIDQDGSELYYESQPAVNMVRSSVNVMIGEGLTQAGVPSGGIAFDDFSPVSGTKYLQMRIDGNQPGGLMEVGSVPYAVYAQTALKIDPNILAADVPDVFVSTEELTMAINTESSTRQSADINLQTQVTSLQAALATETTARINGDANSLTTSTSFGGAVTGSYNNLQIGTAAVGTNQISDETVTAAKINQASTSNAGLTPVAFGTLASPADGCTVLTQKNVISADVTDSGNDCLSKDRGCRVTFNSIGTSNYIVLATNLEGQNGTDDNPAACDKSANSVTVSGGPAGAKIDFIIFKP